ncbi:hypothetical protein SAMN05216480_105207 [Pustulibacterium marinum]|uniref:Lipoprotein n=1 Tax=Pustulibacterium marinum TaxID=1224947 RepID=A0A1I7GRP0_9FLAO|nr:hypothetical protein [Pustulibacterium marinum]SFU51051.1 hypothetical protein SAMN05216480_105207 [Pustulibacterium marinum]
MKKYVTYLFFLTIIFGCDKIDELTQFNVDYTSTVTIPSSSVINLPIDIYTPEIESNSESTFSVNDTRKDLVEEVKLEEFNLTLISPETGDLSFLQTIEIYINADDLSEIKIAWKENIPDDVGTLLELETTDSDLKEYIKKDSFQLRVKTITDEMINQDHEIEVYANFFVDAKILGV